MDFFFQIVGALILINAGAMSFTLGVAIACRMLGWAPMNINVTVNHHAAED